MQERLSNLQKVTLLYIGILTKHQKYLKRSDVTRGIRELIEIHPDRYDSFSVTFSFSIKSLVTRGLVEKKGRIVTLTNEGRENAREIRQQVVDRYHKINWELIRRYYGEE